MIVDLIAQARHLAVQAAMAAMTTAASSVQLSLATWLLQKLWGSKRSQISAPDPNTLDILAFLPQAIRSINAFPRLVAPCVAIGAQFIG
eukprot:8357147-Karenia_brevis.AAC.1